MEPRPPAAFGIRHGSRNRAANHATMRRPGNPAGHSNGRPLSWQRLNPAAPALIRDAGNGPQKAPTAPGTRRSGKRSWRNGGRHSRPGQITPGLPRMPEATPQHGGRPGRLTSSGTRYALYAAPPPRMLTISFRTAAIRSYSGTVATGKAYATNATAGSHMARDETPEGRNRKVIRTWV